jgi:hypothetical protein
LSGWEKQQRNVTVVEAWDEEERRILFEKKLILLCLISAVEMFYSTCHTSKQETGKLEYKKLEWI